MDETQEALGSVDPVSGNPVPPGGTPKGVRDDIPANLSEGEFVIPANVVRFIGVNTLIKLVEDSEKALTKMEKKGRMGQKEAPPAETPAPVQEEEDDIEFPFDPASLEAEEVTGNGPVNFNKGGLVDQDRIGFGQTQPNTPSPPGIKVFRDRTGFLRYLPVVNGQVIGQVPEGAQEVPGASTPNNQNQQKPQPAQQEGNSGKQKEEPIGPNISEMSAQEARQGLQGMQDIRNSTFGKAGMIAASQLVPGVGKAAALSARPIANAYADQVLSEDYGVESRGVLGAIFGGTALGRIMGFDDPIKDLEAWDTYKDVVTNYEKNNPKGTDPSSDWSGGLRGSTLAGPGFSADFKPEPEGFAPVNPRGKDEGNSGDRGSDNSSGNVGGDFGDRGGYASPGGLY